MHSQTLVSESMDASADSGCRVCGCILQLNKRCNCIVNKQKVNGITQTLFVQLKVLLIIIDRGRLHVDMVVSFHCNIIIP